ncbi:4620_t:CDS:2 [Diversispora eburnea]|uniref:4620_t:CDS:1 n=1 Tax=Diversispora eburnea TaxID=1213867 RepID=A0A9N9AFD9_9GLOM|nr:4620_t:CDS:2 [Diversispora eburnea]
MDMSLPEELKFINTFLQRAQELQKREPVIAYYCNYYSAKLALEKGTKAKESKAYLAKLLDLLEQEKKNLGDNEAVTNDIAGEAYVENFALKVFLNADNEDRAGKASRKTAKNFLAAAIFLELLKIFGELSSENQEKIKYSKWKATQIIKALKDGQIPTPGPPGGEADSLSDESVDNIPGIDQLPSDTSLDSSTIDSQSPFPTYHSTPNSVYHNVSPPNSDLHSGVHDLTSSLNQMDLNNNQQIPPNIPPKGNEFSGGSFPNINNSSFQQPINFQTQTGPQYYDMAQNNPQPSTPILHQPQLQQPNYGITTSYQPTIPESHHNNQQFMGYSKSSLQSQNYVDIDPNTVSQAQKHCKWAISALNYNDVKTAVENIQKTLAMLEPYNQ